MTENYNDQGDNNTEVQTSPDAPQEPAAKHTGRKWGVGLLITLGLILLVVANLTFWAWFTLLNTNGWVTAVGPLSKDPTVSGLLSQYVVTELFEQVDVEMAIEQSLPPEFQILSVALTTGLEKIAFETADGLIQSGAAKSILLLTAETYTKYIDEEDRSLRTIFGDAAAATLISPADQPSLSGFQFGSDGSGGDMLLVADGGARCAEQALRPRHRKRWKSRLYMDGPSLINFTVEAIPRLIDEILEANQLSDDQIDKYLMHQATWKMLDQLRSRMGVSEERVPIELAEVGNTVSCTLPILIDRVRKQGQIDAESVNMLVGFGVGLSWAGCLWRDQWSASV